jgi:HEAT repeat protein
VYLIRTLAVPALLLTLLTDTGSTTGGGTSPAPAPTPQEQAYAAGTAALDQKRWEKAVEAFSEAARLPGEKAAAALYWQGYALHKSGKRPDALAALQTLKSRFPESRWVADARALEVELGAASPTASEAGGEEELELKLIAIDSLMRQEPERALPHIERILAGPGSPDLKERALFVLAQSSSPKAREILVRTAKGDRHPEVQEEAIRYLGMHGGTGSRELLEEIYRAARSREAREAVLDAFLLVGDKDRILAIFRAEKDPELRRAALDKLGPLKATAEIWKVYQTETDGEVREAAINALYVAGDLDHLQELARSEKDVELRRKAVQSLGLFKGERTEGAILGIYRSERSAEVREAALDALMVQGNARALVEIARSERDRELRKRAVERLSTMKAREAQDYMMELLGK